MKTSINIHRRISKFLGGYFLFSTEEKENSSDLSFHSSEVSFDSSELFFRAHVENLFSLRSYLKIFPWMFFRLSQEASQCDIPGA